MSSFTGSSPASNNNALPSSGDGQSYKTAQYTSELNKDPTQPSFIVYRQLQPVKWLRCTYTEAEYYKGLNYQVWSNATGRLLRPPHATGTVQQADRAAFLEQYEKVVKAEDALETADIQVTHDEGLMEDASDGGDFGENIFDEPMWPSKEQTSREDNYKGKV